MPTHLSRRSLGGASRTTRWRRATASATAVALGVTMSIALTGSAGAATTLKLVTHVGNGTGGKIVKIANRARNKLTGPKGTGLTRGITKKSVKIGCVTTTASYVGYQTGIEAAFHNINKKGINGRKLTLAGTCKNDNNSTATNTTDNQQLVTQTKVFAVLSLSAYELPGATNFLNNNQVPYTGWGFDPGFCGNRWGFGWNGCLGGNAVTEPVEALAGNLVQAVVSAAKIPPKKIRFAVQAAAGLSGTIGNSQYDAEVNKMGGTVVYSEHNYPTTATGVDNTPYVSAMINAKPNLIFLSTPFTDVGPLAAQLKAAGYTGVIMDYTNYIPGLLAASKQLASALQGEYVNTQVVPAEQGGKYDKAIAKALKAIGKTPFVTLGGFMGYAQADLMAGMIKAAGKKLNTKTFTKAVNGKKKGFKSYANGPAQGPGKIIWPAAHYLPADCASIVQVETTTYNVISKFHCYTSFLITKKK